MDRGLTLALTGRQGELEGQDPTETVSFLHPLEGLCGDGTKSGVPRQEWVGALEKMLPQWVWTGDRHAPSRWGRGCPHYHRWLAGGAQGEDEGLFPSLQGTLRGPGNPFRAGAVSLHDSHQAECMHRPLAHGGRTVGSSGAHLW